MTLLAKCLVSVPAHSILSAAWEGGALGLNRYCSARTTGAIRRVI